MKRMKTRFIGIFVAICVIMCGCAAGFAEDREEQYLRIFPNWRGYRLKRVVMLSRHGVRAPMPGSLDVNDLTTHDISKWSVEPYNLTHLGGLIETITGQFFRQVFEAEDLVPKDWSPEEGEVRVLANNTQRTIASARYFVTGLLPTENVNVEVADDTAGNVFSEALTFISKAYLEQVESELMHRTNGLGAEWVYKDLADEILILENLLDFSNSEYAKKNNIEHIPTDELEMILEAGSWPDVKGGLQIAAKAADALGLYQLEGKDELGTLFGKPLSEEENAAIMSIWDTYTSILFCMPSVAVNSAHPMLKELKKELTFPGRVFSCLYGHDANILSVLTALKSDYVTLVGTVGSNQVPVGSKLIFAVWEGPDKKDYVSVSLVNMRASQIRNKDVLNLNILPDINIISFDGLKTNKDGAYRLEDILTRFDEAIDAYDKLPKDEDASDTSTVY